MAKHNHGGTESEARSNRLCDKLKDGLKISKYLTANSPSPDKD